MKSLIVAASLAVATIAGVGAAYAAPAESYLEYQDRQYRTLHKFPQADAQRASDHGAAVDAAGNKAAADAKAAGANQAGQNAARDAARDAANRAPW